MKRLFFGVVLAFVVIFSTGCKMPIEKDQVYGHVVDLVNMGSRSSFLEYGQTELGGGNKQARDYLLNKFTAMGLENVHLQQFYFLDIFKGEFVQIPCQNVFGQITGSTYPEKIILIGAHFDTMTVEDCDYTGHGASDNATGVATMLEIARYFAENRPAYTMRFVGFNREEADLEGSKGYYDQSIETGEINNTVMMFNLDDTQSNSSSPLAPLVFFVLSPNAASWQAFAQVKAEMGVVAANIFAVTPKLVMDAVNAFIQMVDPDPGVYWGDLNGDVQQWKYANVIIGWPWAFDKYGHTGTIENVSPFGLAITSSFSLNFLRKINDITPDKLSYINQMVEIDPEAEKLLFEKGGVAPYECLK